MSHDGNTIKSKDCIYWERICISWIVFTVLLIPFLTRRINEFFLFHPFRFMIALTSGSFRNVHFSSKRSKGFLPMKDINWIRLGCTTVLLTVWGWDISTISLWKPTNLKFQFQQLGTDGCTMQVFNWIQKTSRKVLFWIKTSFWTTFL